MNTNDKKINNAIKYNRKNMLSYVFFLMVLVISFGFGVYAAILSAWMIAFWSIIAGFAFVSAFFNEKRVNVLLVKNAALKDKLDKLENKKK